ncbi:MAG: esterase/lipase family protein [Pirellula sp.]|jgi:pimeloyl-ACP methyl ester carboxylesterase
MPESLHPRATIHSVGLLVAKAAGCRLLVVLAVTGIAALSMFGCASQKYALMRPIPSNPLTETLQLASKSGPQVTSRTMTLLRNYALADLSQKDPTECLTRLQEIAIDEKGAEKIYATSELAYTIGKREETAGRSGVALDLYNIAVTNAYLYLFCPDLDVSRNPYDPQFRGACDLYNVSLEAMLRLMSTQGEFRPGRVYRINTAKQDYDVNVVARGAWKDADFDQLEFCSDYQVQGLEANNVTYGVGVSLIAVRKPHSGVSPTERYYPEGLSFPVTALLRVTNPTVHGAGGSNHRYPCVLELYDPLDATDINLNSRLVPLQTDLSTPLAYFLDNPKFREQTNSTLGLLDPSRTDKLRGIYMLEPFDPNRIPVLMVHGLWSSPMTWMPMFNDLRSFDELRKNYQFWFYQYPTGQPFWVSATQLRSDLNQMKQTLDPDGRYPVMDNIVMVGHSMGGLLSRMQTIESGNEFWSALSDKPFEELKGDEAEIQRLQAVMFFKPNPSVKRVVTIGTPHRGSEYANDTTRWLGKKIIKLPSTITDIANSVVRQNPGLFFSTELLTTNTSIDSLSPESPIFPPMLRAPRAPWVHYHNIIGVVSKSSWFGEPIPSDGLVTVESAMMPDVESEIMVESKHQDIHRQPRAILEVRRILVNHLRELSQYPQMMSILKLPKNGSYSVSGPLIPLEEALANSATRSRSSYSQTSAGDGSPRPSVIQSLSDRNVPVIFQASKN